MQPAVSGRTSLLTYGMSNGKGSQPLRYILCIEFLERLDMDPQADSRPFSWGIVWGLLSLLAGLACWIIGDGKSAGVNPPISENAKLGVTLLGWPYVIDDVRMMGGRRSFMRRVYPWALYALGFALAVLLVIWIYDALSLKGLVAIGLIVAIALLVFILRELRKSRT